MNDERYKQIVKDNIKQWLDDKRFYWTDGNLTKDGTGEAIDADAIEQCFDDLRLSNEWVSVDDKNDYPQLIKGGTLTFWHKVHKCEITGFIVENELEDKIMQGQYSVIEQTKTTKWPMESFSFARAPSLPPKARLSHEMRTL